MKTDNSPQDEVDKRTNQPFAILKIVAKGFFWPALGAIFLILISAYFPWQPPAPIASAIKGFFPILFFIMFFVGQYKRVEKQTDDKDAFAQLNEQFFSLKDLVKRIPVSQKNDFIVQQRALGDANSLIGESYKLLDEGYKFASLLQAGVAFEHAVRNYARLMKLDKADRIPLRNIISGMRFPDEIISEFHSLREIRNRVSHASEEDIKELDDAKMILNGFEWGINEINDGIDRFFNRPFPVSSEISTALYK